MNKKTKKIIITIIGAIVLLLGMAQIYIYASDTIAPSILFYEKSGEVLKNSKIGVYISDESGVTNIKYSWDYATNQQEPTIIQKDPTETAIRIDLEVPTANGLHVLWIRAMDKYGNETTWIKQPYYVVDTLSGKTDTTRPQLDLTHTDDFPLSKSNVELERKITIRATDDMTGITYIAYRWTQDNTSAGTSSDYTITYETDTVVTYAPNQIGKWYLQIFMADGTKNQSSVISFEYNIIDNIKPTLTLNGDENIDVELGSAFTDLGATFNDNYDAQKIVYSTDIVDVNKRGTYVLTYKTTDSSGNESNAVTRNVTVVGTEDTYELTLPTKKTYKIREGLDLTGAQIKEISKRGVETIIPVTEEMFSEFSTQTIGLQSAYFTYKDEKLVYTYKVEDYVTGLELTLPDKLIYEYKEQLDVTGGLVRKVMASGIEMPYEKMNMSMISGFTSDNVGKVKLTVSYLGKKEYFEIEIVDSYAPEITLIGENPQIIEVGSNYEELGATATDVYDDEKGIELYIIKDSSNINTSKIGEYEVIYTCADSLGKTTKVKRIVKVVDTQTIPVTTLLGNEVESIEIGENYVDAGATAFDSYDGDLTDRIITTIKKHNGEIANTIDTSVSEIYTIIYNVSDVSGNNAEPKTRTLHVVNHSELNRLRNEVVPGLNKDDYYSSSWENLQNVINDLQVRYTTQTEIDQAVERVKNAINSLVTILSRLSYNLNSVTYNGLQQPVIVTAAEGVENLGTITVKYNGNTEAPINVGIYNITVDIEGTTEYEAKSNISLGNYEIVKKSVIVKADNKTSMYGDALVELTYTIPEGTLVGNDNKEALGVTLVKEDGLTVGNYAITGPSSSANYDVTVEPANYEITKKTVTVKADNKTSVYGDALVELTYTVDDGILVGNDDKSALGITLVKEDGLTVGNYAITGTSNSTNYDVTVEPANYEITKKAVTVKADNKSSVYGDALAELTYTVDDGILVGNDDKSALGITLVKADGLTVGNYAITGTSNSTNYDVTVEPANYEITKKVVTVKADNKTSVYGDALVELTYTIPEGTLVENDEKSALEITLVKEDGLTVGNYAITGTSNSANYDVTVEPANYEITKKVVTVRADNKTSVYGDALAELTYTIPEGTLVGNDNKEALGVTLVKEDGLTVGNYKITGTSNSTNYDVTVEPANYEITKKAVTVKADNKTSVYGDALVELTYTISEGTLVGNDNEDALGVTLVKEDGLIVGNYVITGTSNSTNYDVTVEPANYEITRRTPVLSDLVYDLTSKQYTGEAQGLTITANESLVGFGDITVKYYQGEQQVGTPVAKGMYTVKVNIAEGANYAEVTDMVVGNYEITAKAPTIEDLSYDLTSKEYNGQEQAVEVTAKAGIVGLGTITVKYNGSTEIPVNAGTYNVTVDIATGANYDSATDMQIGTYTITKKNVTVENFDYVLTAKDYNTQEQPIEVTAKAGVVGLGTITVKYNGSTENPVNANNYEISIDVTEGLNYNAVNNMILGTYVINKIDPVAPIVNSLTAIYGQTLENVMLPTVENGTLTWNDKTLSVGDATEVGNKFIATFTPSDTINYNVLNNIEVNIIVEKANPKYPTIGNLTAVYGQTLENVILPTLENGTLTWNDKTLSVGDATEVGNKFIATFTPNDIANHNILSDVEINVIVEKADGTLNPDYELPTLEEIVYNENKTLSIISLPNGWLWIDENTVPTVNKNEYPAKYTSSNSNYKDVYTNIALRVLEPADQTELNNYLTQINYTNLVETDYSNFQGLRDLVNEAYEQTAQVYLDNIVAQIKQYTLNPVPVNQTELTNYMVQVNKLVPTDYNNWDDLEAKVAEAYAVTDLQSKFDAKLEEVKYFKLSIKIVDKSELIEIERQIANLNKDDYTQESWNKIQELIEQAKAQKLQSKFDEIVENIDLTTLETKQVSSIEIVNIPNKTTYIYGDSLDLTGGILRVNYNNGTTKNVRMLEEGVTVPNFTQVNTTLGQQVLTVVYEGQQAIYRIEVIDQVIDIEINTQNMKKDYKYGEEIDLTNATVKPIMKSNSEAQEVAISIDMISGYNSSLVDNQTIKVTYLGYEKNFEVSVKDYIVGIKVTSPSKKSYIMGDELDLTGMVVTAMFASNNEQTIENNEITVNGYNNSILGAQEITVEYKEFTDSFRIVVIDSTKPTIALTGKENVTVEVGTSYTDEGATAYGDDGELRVNVTYVKVIEGQEETVTDIDTSILATYKVKYNVTDSRNNKADEVIRTVQIVDTTKPTIIIDNTNVYETEVKTNIPTIKATVRDNYDQNPTLEIITNNINLNKVGTYTIIFKAKDSSGNETIETREFKVIDTQVPTIKLNGNNPQIVQYGDAYTELGAIAEDNAGNFMAKANLNNLDTTKLGTYTIIYTAKDESGNEATPVERIVKVVDTKAPEFSRFVDGEGTVVSIVKGTEYIDQGVIFNDNYDGQIIVSGTGVVNYNKVGTYTITYKVTDSSGNESEEIVRTVRVTDFPPVISYYDEYGAKVILNDNKVFNYYPVVFFNRGTAKLIKDGNIVTYAEEELSDGTYTITVTADDGTSTTRNFIVDTKAPVISGVRTGRYKNAVTITFEDVNDVTIATLTNATTNEVIDIKKYLQESGQNTYKVETTGTYILQVEDEHGNAIRPITFRVQMPTV